MTSIGFGGADPSAGAPRLFALLRCAWRVALDSFAVQGRSRYTRDMQGKHLLGFAVIAALGLATAPALASPTPKKPTCQVNKNLKETQQRETRRTEPCRRPAPIPWVVDPTPMFLISVPDSLKLSTGSSVSPLV